jgi:hypothetical protein
MLNDQRTVDAAPVGTGTARKAAPGFTRSLLCLYATVCAEPTVGSIDALFNYFKSLN